MRTTDSVQLSLIKCLGWGEKNPFLHSSQLRWPIPLPTEGRLLGSVQLLGRAWHASAAVTEGIGSAVPDSIDLGRDLSFFFVCFFCEVPHTLTVFPAFWVSETGGAHHSSKSGNYHILAFLTEGVSLWVRINHTRWNLNSKIQRDTAGTLPLVAMVVGGCRY